MSAAELLAIDVRRPVAGRPPGPPVVRSAETVAHLAQLRALLTVLEPALRKPGPSTLTVPTPGTRAARVDALRLLIALRCQEVPWRELAKAAGRAETCEAGRKLYRRLAAQVRADHGL